LYSEAYGPRREPQVAEWACDHLHRYSRVAVTTYDNYDTEIQCEDQEYCDLFEKNECPLVRWFGIEEQSEEELGEHEDY
jgi:hypothetical protein